MSHRKCRTFNTYSCKILKDKDLLTCGGPRGSLNTYPLFAERVHWVVVEVRGIEPLPAMVGTPSGAPKPPPISTNPSASLRSPTIAS